MTGKREGMSRRAVVGGATAAALAGGATALPSTAATGTTTAAATPGPVLELRQYKIHHGRRDDMVALFEREFVASQNAIGMRIAGTFRDADDPDRFTWIREFPSMASRGTYLADFYGGPVWKAHRDEANALLDDNDNVLLLRPAWDGADLPDPAPPAAPGGLVVAFIHYLWKDPAVDLPAFFRDRAAAAAAAGLPVLGAFVPVAEPNNFPRLPVRAGEKVFVWISHVGGADELATTRGELARRLTRADAERLADFEERQPQVLRLLPTSTSALR